MMKIFCYSIISNFGISGGTRHRAVVSVMSDYRAGSSVSTAKDQAAAVNPLTLMNTVERYGANWRKPDGPSLPEPSTLQSFP
jgi:hypothetical protein